MLGAARDPVNFQRGTNEVACKEWGIRITATFESEKAMEP